MPGSLELVVNFFNVVWRVMDPMRLLIGVVLRTHNVMQ